MPSRQTYQEFKKKQDEKKKSIKILEDLNHEDINIKEKTWKLVFKGMELRELEMKKKKKNSYNNNNYEQGYQSYCGNKVTITGNTYSYDYDYNGGSGNFLSDPFEGNGSSLEVIGFYKN